MDLLINVLTPCIEPLVVIFKPNELHLGLNRPSSNLFVTDVFPGGHPRRKLLLSVHFHWSFSSLPVPSVDWRRSTAGRRDGDGRLVRKQTGSIGKVRIKVVRKPVQEENRRKWRPAVMATTSRLQVNDYTGTQAGV